MTIAILFKKHNPTATTTKLQAVLTNTPFHMFTAGFGNDPTLCQLEMHQQVKLEVDQEEKEPRVSQSSVPVRMGALSRGILLLLWTVVNVYKRILIITSIS